MTELGIISISSQMSREFARLSGDFNPLHLDPVLARRTQFGRTLIHGVCGTVKAIDHWMALNQDPVASIQQLHVRYSKPISQHQEITLRAESDAQQVRLELHAGGARCQIIDLVVRQTDPGAQLQPEFIPAIDSPPQCKQPDIAQCEGDCDSVELIWDAELARILFPTASAALPPRQLASILATTHIVGMKYPGLHSVYSKLELEFSDAGGEASNTDLHYNIAKADTRINRLEIGICNAYVQGRIEAFFRAAPIKQASIEQILPLVGARLFSNQRALVVGASRGLGEVIAKALAAGGAEIMLTYARGVEDAQRVADDIASARAAPALCRYDVLEGEVEPEMRAFLNGVTHIYYLASPIIEKGEAGHWNSELFNRYCRFYIHGMATLLQQIRSVTGPESPLQLFIPSSVFLDGKIKGFDEYITAKSGAETYVQRLAAADSNWQVVAPRLPRLHTDQTSGVRGTDQQQTLEVIVEMLQEAFPG